MTELNTAGVAFRSGEIAIAHDYLTQKGGAERVVLALHRMWPEAPIYTTFYDPEGTFPEFQDAQIITSPLNRVGVLRKDPRRALPLLPLASSLMRVKEPLAVVSSPDGPTGSATRGTPPSTVTRRRGGSTCWTTTWVMRDRRASRDAWPAHYGRGSRPGIRRRNAGARGT